MDGFPQHPFGTGGGLGVPSLFEVYLGYVVSGLEVAGEELALDAGGGGVDGFQPGFHGLEGAECLPGAALGVVGPGEIELRGGAEGGVACRQWLQQRLALGEGSPAQVADAKSVSVEGLRGGVRQLRVAEAGLLVVAVEEVPVALGHERLDTGGGGALGLPYAAGQGEAVAVAHHEHGAGQQHLPGGCEAACGA